MLHFVTKEVKSKSIRVRRVFLRWENRRRKCQYHKLDEALAEESLHKRRRKVSMRLTRESDRTLDTLEFGFHYGSSGANVCMFKSIRYI